MKNIDKEDISAECAVINEREDTVSRIVSVCKVFTQRIPTILDQNLINKRIPDFKHLKNKYDLR